MLKIVTVPAQILTKPTKPVEKIDDKIKKIVFDMEKILVAQNDPPGVGLAANQVGLNLSFFIIKPSEKAKIKVFINPKIIKVSQSQLNQSSQSKSVISNQLKSDKPTTDNRLPIQPITDSTKKKRARIKLEGCLSIPRIWGPVKRADKIFLHYQDFAGKKHLKWFFGFEATIIQHEIDHLKGVVFTQRSLEQKGQLYKEENEELVKIEY